jgi:hypothetical protein
MVNDAWMTFQTITFSYQTLEQKPCLRILFFCLYENVNNSYVTKALMSKVDNNLASAQISNLGDVFMTTLGSSIYSYQTDTGQERLFYSVEYHNSHWCVGFVMKMSSYRAEIFFF